MVVDVADEARTVLEVVALHQGLLPLSPIRRLKHIVFICHHVLHEFLAWSRFQRHARLGRVDRWREGAELIVANLLGLLHTGQSLLFHFAEADFV